MVAIQQIAENADLCKNPCQDHTKVCAGLRIAKQTVSRIWNTET